MDNLDAIIQNYKKISTQKLILISREPSSLDIRIIPYLQAELIARTENEEALLLSEYLIKSTEKKTTYNDYSKEELNKIIKERMDSGESLESVKINLKDNGINILNTLGPEHVSDAKMREYLSSLRNDKLGEAEIQVKMKAAFRITQAEIDVLTRQLRSNGTSNITIGIIITVLMVLIALLGREIKLTSVIFLIIAISFIFKGIRQRK